MRTVELEIHDIAFGGAGVGRADDKAFFVPFTIDGEKISARSVREKKQFAEAELEQVLERSSHRVEPPCPYFGRCGGCSYQHIAYEHQLAIKTKQVEQALHRIGHIEHPPMHAIIPSPKPYQYRNRITVHADDGVLGYYRRDRHQLIDIEWCPIAQPAVNHELGELRARRPRDGHYTLRAHSGPRVFAQTNDEVAANLAQLVVGFPGVRQHLLIDAYCGAGFFAKHLVHQFERVVGIEWDRFAVAAARESAWPNEMYIEGDVDLELSRHLAAADLGTTAVIIDPPATGLTSDARRALLDHSPNTLVYVSCNPPTLARDLAELRQGFTIESITPLDMFPQTAEIEVVAHLSAI